ncbi:TonB-dependent receptor [Solitalea sp. MAHUQ-68]|uniref:TonB-dependent receptor n=1 Tax=Solitalea agri TaxID=2953739 RepID=A0A9X2JD38_9SPHI|nr:TonB-dependent receptor [Solitalea agri]MCO4292450.1 TonB-dependent receptor [Solitalea agri]
MKKALLILITLTLSHFALAQFTLKGRVTDKSGNPIAGASVTEKGTTNGNSTNANGYYSFKCSSQTATIVFSNVGYFDHEEKLNGQTTLNATLDENTSSLAEVEVVGTRNLKRSVTDSPVPVDLIPVSKIANATGMVDINTILQYAAPSFNANKQSGSDGADHIEPATLRGMGPDQTLVLINGKRRHQSSLVNLYGTRGRGNTGTDMNAIPSASIERIEILRDGASAQYGSDAIAGVINIVLKQSTDKLDLNFTAGGNSTGYGGSLESGSDMILKSIWDGKQYSGNVNYGLKVGSKGGFFNITGDIDHKDKTYRPNYTTLYPDNYRAEFGDASYTNYSFMLNSRIPLKKDAEVYFFGGLNKRDGDAFAWTRDPESERNVIEIYPNGFNPHIGSNITDYSGSGGVRTKIWGWNSDFNATYGRNRFEYDVTHTLNASLEAASPTSFKAGGFYLGQFDVSANFSKTLQKALNGNGISLAWGLEFRNEQYKIFAGNEDSWKQYGPVIFSIDNTTTPPDTTFRPGGAQGFPGFQPKDVISQSRNNIGGYLDTEFDLTKEWMVAAAIRFENYSDFGSTTNFKIATRYKASPNVNIRGSFSSGFRAPSLPQIAFSSTFTNVAAGKIVDQVIAPNHSDLAFKAGIPRLKEEKSLNASLGFTAKPINNLSLTFDGYWVQVKDRIVLTGLFTSDDDVIGSTLEEMNVGAAQFFTNAVDTRTYGLDIITSYAIPLGANTLNTTFAANFNKMELDAIHTTPALEGKEDIYFGPREKSFLLASAPHFKINLSFDYRMKKSEIFLRFNQFSGVDLTNWNDKVDEYAAKVTTDLSYSYTFNKHVNFTVGGNNIFDVYPSHHDPAATESGGMWDAVQMGFSGAYFFGRFGFNF